jgi:hypothetical protein
MDEALHQHAETIADALKGSLLVHSIAYGELTITIPPGDIVAAVKVLRDDERCQYFSIIERWIGPAASRASTSFIISFRPATIGASG